MGLELLLLNIFRYTLGVVWNTLVNVAGEPHHQATPGSPSFAGCYSVLMMSYRRETWVHLHLSCPFLKSSSSVETAEATTISKSSSNHSHSTGRHHLSFNSRASLPILKNNDMLFMQSLPEAYERSNSGNTDWFAFIRAQRRVLVVGPGQGWEVFVVNGKVLRLLVRWLCDHSNYGEKHFNEDLRVIGWE